MQQAGLGYQLGQFVFFLIAHNHINIQRLNFLRRKLGVATGYYYFSVGVGASHLPDVRAAIAVHAVGKTQLDQVSYTGQVSQNIERTQVPGGGWLRREWNGGHVPNYSRM